MNPDPNEVEPALAFAHDTARAFLETLDSRRPGIVPEPRPEAALEEQGLGAVGALERLWDRFGEAFAGSSGPRYWGFVHGGLTPAALAADWLCATVDQSAQMHGDGPSAQIEKETIGLLRALFGLPEAYSGNFVSGGTMANASGLAIGLQVLGTRFGVDVSRQGVAALGPVAILSGESHASIAMAAALLGLGRNAVERLPQEPGREHIVPEALADRLRALQGRPVIVVGNAGTVNSGDFDQLDALGQLAQAHGAHFHVDGAFGLFAALSPKHAPLLNGLVRAGTIASDAHKWLNVPYDSGFVFTRHLDAQLGMFMNESAYLPPPTADPLNVQNLSPENSRRLRALPAWATLQAYGRDGYRAIVERCCGLAESLAGRLADEPGFRLLAQVRLNVVCFQLLEAGEPADLAATRAFVDRVTRDGRVRVTASMLWDQPCIRLAFVNWRTREADLDVAMEAFRSCCG